MNIILGIDPGSRATGFGVIESNGRTHRYIASGCIRTSGDVLSERLNTIFTGISELLQTYQPTEAAIENVFVKHNVSSALKLGQARGAAITAIAGFGLTVAEYSPRVIKQAIVGYGAAEKGQMQQMVKAILNLSKVPQVDAADALAIAMCHAHSRTVMEKI